MLTQSHHTAPAAAIAPAPRQANPALPELRVCDRPGADRAALEAFIAGVFADAYGASVTGFMPVLAGLVGDGEPLGALGLRGAARQPLFCERYLERPVEHYARSLYGAQVPRQRLMELGNLAVVRGGHSGILYLLVALALQQAGVDYLLFAANRAVRRSLSRCGFAPRAIGPARAQCLGDSADDWGRYYDSDPVVMLADVGRTVRQACTQPGMVALMAHYAPVVPALAAAVVRECQ